MSCTEPLHAYESEYTHPSGKKKLVFNPAKSIDGKVIPLPCGKCDDCLLTRAKTWARRCMHEASLHEDNIFVTLTYDQDHLPRDLSLYKNHWQKFIRAVRDKYRETNPKIQFLMCGEYGTPTRENNWVARPHYHGLLFNFAFPDQKLVSRQKHAVEYSSESCTKIWGKGLIHIGEVTANSVAYVSSYTLKKLGRKQSKKPYEVFNPYTGETNPVQPEYIQMSNHPGIGKGWYDKYKKTIYPTGQLHLGKFAPFPGDEPRKMSSKTPAYYDKLLERERPDMMEFVSENRKQFAKDHAENFTPARLDARAIITKQRLSWKQRKL